MAVITLEEVRKGQLTDLEKGVIDEFTRGDYLFQNINDQNSHNDNHTPKQLDFPFY